MIDPNKIRVIEKDIGFWDQGFVSGIVRTDYNSQKKGSEVDPLTLEPCLHTGNDSLLVPAGASWGRSGCSLSPSVFSQSNSFTNASSWPMNNFWVLSANNEPAYQKIFNSGPPNQSLPISEPGKGVMGFAVKNENHHGYSIRKVHLALDHTFAPKGAEGYIPFLGIGADMNRGNGKPISLLNASSKRVPHKVRFTAKMLREKNIGSPGTAGFFWLIVTARWHEKPRMIFIPLYHNNVLEHETTDGKFTHGHWNWNIKDSFNYPGGDLIYMEAEDATSLGVQVPRIASVGEEVSYTVDLQKLFEIVSLNKVTFDTPMPQSSDIPITGVHWAVEMTGKDTELWFSVHGMEMQ